MTAPSHSSVAIVVVGDVMVDSFVLIDAPLSPGVDQPMRLVRRVGGQAANTSAWLAWSGVPVHLVAACGDDEEGDWIQDRLSSRGVRTHLVRGSEPTGSCIVVVDPTGERTMFSRPTTSATLAELCRSRVSTIWQELGSVPVTHLHLSGYLLDRDPTLAADLARHAPGGTTVSMDTAAFRPNADHRRALKEVLAHLDVLIGTAQELSALLDSDASTVSEVASLARLWQTRFDGTVVVKQGAEGASAFDGGDLLTAPALTSEVVDTTGAGDALAAGFLATWVLDRAALPQALESGIQAAARAVGHIGADPPAQEGR